MRKIIVTEFITLDGVIEAPGGGLRIFDDGREFKKFGLKQSRTFDNGVLILEYQPIS